MPRLPDIKTSAIKGNDVQQQLDSVVRQVNDWGKLISNAEVNNIFKVVKIVDITIPAFTMTQDGVFPNTYSGTGVIDSYEHGLGFAPAFIAYISTPSTNTNFPFPYTDVRGGASGGIMVITSGITVDSGAINAYHQAEAYGTHNFTGETVDSILVRVYLMQEIIIDA